MQKIITRQKYAIRILTYLVPMFLLTSCFKNTYMNTRAIVPVFEKKQRVVGEVYLGQGIASIGGDLAISPVRRTFVTAGFNKGTVGDTWEAGIGGVPLKYKMLQWSLLTTYGKASIHQKFNKMFRPIDYGENNISVNAEYERYSATTYISFVPRNKVTMSIGIRFNRVEYFWYQEKRKYSKDRYKDFESSHRGADSLSFIDNMVFSTIDPFMKMSYCFYENFGITILLLNSNHNSFKKEGRGYIDRQSSAGAVTIRENYSYKSEIPDYKKIVINVALVIVF